MLKSFLKLLTPKQLKKAFLLLLFTLFGSILETIGIGIIIPLLSLANPNNKSLLKVKIENFTEQLGFSFNILTIVILTILVIFVIKSIYMTWLINAQNRFVFGVRSALSESFFTKYLQQPWSFHLNVNSGAIINTLANEINLFTASFLLPLVQMTAEVFVIALMAALLVYVEPVGAIVCFSALMIVLLVYFFATRGVISFYSKQRQFHESQRVKHIQQGLSSIKDIKVLGREGYFIDAYRQHNVGSTKAVEKLQTLQNVPRLWIEFFAVALVCVLCLIMNMQGKSQDEMFPILAVFAMATFRLSPSVNRFVTFVHQLRSSKVVINALSSEFRQFKSLSFPIHTSIDFQSRIEIKNLSFSYGEHKVIDDISLSISKGESIGLVGESGSGKSTFVNILLGVLPPSSGQILIDGVEIQDNVKGWQDKVGYVQQDIYLIDDSLRKNIAFGIPDKDINENWLKDAIKSAQLDDLVSQLEHGVDTLVGERGVKLSGGQRQRIGIARALYHKPTVLILDEATSALDNETEQYVVNAVNGLMGRLTIIIIAHRTTTLAKCSRIYSLQSGKLIDMV